MNPLRKFEGDNPGFDDPDNHGDLWSAIHKCHTRIAVVDERIRVALIFALPVLGFVVAIQLACLGALLK